MWEYRLSGDSPGFVPLHQQVDQSLLLRGSSDDSDIGSASNSSGMAVVFPRAGCVIAMQQDGAAAMVEVAPPSEGFVNYQYDDISSGASGSGSDNGGGSLWGLMPAFLGGSASPSSRKRSQKSRRIGGVYGSTEEKVHVGSSLGQDGAVYWWQEGSNNFTIVNCGGSHGASPKGRAARAAQLPQAWHVHVGNQGGGLAAIEPMSDHAWLLRDVSGGAQLLTWPRTSTSSGNNGSGAMSCLSTGVAPLLQPLDVDRVAMEHDDHDSSGGNSWLSSLASLVHNAGAPSYAPADAHPDGRLMTSSKHHAMIAHGVPVHASSENKAVNVHVFGHPAEYASARAPLALHLRHPMITQLNPGELTSDESAGVEASSEVLGTQGDAMVSVVRRKGSSHQGSSRDGSGDVRLESVDFSDQTLRSLSLNPSSRLLNSQHEKDAAAPTVVDACAVGGSVATLDANGTVRTINYRTGSAVEHGKCTSLSCDRSLE